MKSIEQLIYLAKNPFYIMTDAEAQLLKQAETQLDAVDASVTEDSKKKASSSKRGNAIVKETGKLNKHSTDPISE